MQRNRLIRLNLLTLALCASLLGISQPLRSLYLLSPLTGPVLDYDEIRRCRIMQALNLAGEPADSIRIYQTAPAGYEIEVFEGGVPARMPAPESVIGSLQDRVRLENRELLKALARLRGRLEAGSPVLTLITLRSGSIMQVNTLAVEEEHLIVEVPIGAQPLAIELIAQLQCLDEAIDPRYEYANPVANRYVLGQSAAPLRRGHGYFQNTMLMFNTLSYGLTDRLTATFSMELMTPYLKAQGWLIDSSAFMFSGLSLKYGGRIAPRWHAAGGVMLIGTVLGQIGGAPYVYGIATYGSAEHHLSIRPGILFGRLNAEAQQTHPSLTVSGLTRVSRQIALIAEAGVIRQRIRYFDSPAGAALEEYYSDRYQMTVSASMRVMSRKWAADLGMSAYGVRGIDRIKGEQPHYSKFDLFPFVIPHISVSRAF